VPKYMLAHAQYTRGTDTTCKTRLVLALGLALPLQVMKILSIIITGRA